MANNNNANNANNGSGAEIPAPNVAPEQVNQLVKNEWFNKATQYTTEIDKLIENVNALKIKPKGAINKVKEIITKHNSLEKELSSGSIDPKLFAKKSKEYSNLEGIIKIARKYVNFENEKKDLLNMVQDKSNDQEMIDLAEKDLKELIV